MQAAAKFMVDTDTNGSIVVISSNNAIAHFAGVSVYGSAKAALNKLSEHVAIELAKYGIRVNTISPGWTDTGAARLDAKQDTYYKIPLKNGQHLKRLRMLCFIFHLIVQCRLPVLIL
jgi:NAD(P)-dependent dehydrogenase (short-subunit alcohol dehydrogenase family)